MGKVKQAGEVLSFSDGHRHDENYSNPTELPDSLVIESFLSQMTHPSSRRSSEELGRYIQQLLGRTDSTLNPDQLAWRDRMTGLSVDIDDLDDDDVATLEAADIPLHAILSILRESAKDEHKVLAVEMANERKALLLLRSLRTGVILRNEIDQVSDERWKELIVRLAEKFIRR